MGTSLLQPGVYIQEVPSGVRSIAGVATSIGLFVGWAPRGPTDRAIRLSSFADFERVYGGLDRRSFLGYSVRQFFDNGGRDTYVVRVADGAAVPAALVTGALTVSGSSPGTWGNSYRIRTTRRAAPDDARFRIEVVDHAHNDAVVESFENLSMDAADPRYAPSVINGRSGFIEADIADSDPPPSPPADGTNDLSSTTAGTDGAVLVPDTAAFNTAVLAAFGVGTVTDRIDIFNLVCVPGLTDAATLQTLQTRCHERRAFLIVDSDSTATVDAMRDSVLPGGSHLSLLNNDAVNSAIYFPWVRAPDPLAAGALRDFPPCGYVAGVFARTDATRGVWKAPAGVDASVNGATGFDITLSDAQNGQLNPLGINCLRTLPVYGNVVWGSRTLQGQNDRGSEWKYIPVRRMALFLEESLYRGTQWVVFEPNDEPLWAQIRLNIGAFLQQLFRQGAFQGTSPRDAYFVKCDRETTTQADINLGIVNIHVGFAPLRPAEFVVIRIQQMAGDIPT